MSSLVYFKFKSSLNYDTIQFDGSSISVRDLRNNIRVKCNLRSNDYDLKLQDSNGREFCKEDEQIPKYSSIIVRRVPKVNSEPPRKKIANPEDMTKKDVYLNQPGHSSIPFHQLAKTSNLANSNLSEDEKIKLMMKHSSDQYTEDNYLVKPKPFGAPPLSYICRKCNTGGHWIHNCPGIRDAAGRPVDIKTIKRPTGIPNDLLLEVDAGTPGAYLSKTGNYVVPIKDAEAYAMGKKEKRPFSKEENPPYVPVEEKPPEYLNCPLCKDLLRDAVLVSCCSATYCNDCIMNYVFNADEGANACPNCKSKISDNEKEILENAIIRQMVQEWKNGNKNIAARPLQPNSSASTVLPNKEELPKEEKIFVNNRRVLVPKGSSQPEQSISQNEIKKESTSVDFPNAEIDKENFTEDKKSSDSPSLSCKEECPELPSASPANLSEDNDIPAAAPDINLISESVKQEPEEVTLNTKSEDKETNSEIDEQLESNDKENSPKSSKHDEDQSESSESALDSDLERSDDESTLRRLPDRKSPETTSNKAIKVKSPTAESPIKTFTSKPIRHSGSSGNLTVLQTSNIETVRPRYSGQKDTDSVNIKSSNIVQNTTVSNAYPSYPTTAFYQQPIVPVGTSLYPASVAPAIPPPVHPYMPDATVAGYTAPQYPPPSVTGQTLPAVSAAQWASTSGYNIPTAATTGPYLPPPPGQLLSEEQFYRLKAKLLAQKSRRSRSPSRHSPKHKKLSSKPKKTKTRSPRRRPSFSPPNRRPSHSQSRSGSPASGTNSRRKAKAVKHRNRSPDHFSRSRSPPNDRSRSNSPVEERFSPPSKSNRSKKYRDEHKPFVIKHRSGSHSPRNMSRDNDPRDIGRRYSRKRNYSPKRDESSSEHYIDPLAFYKYMAQLTKVPLQFCPKQYSDLLKQMDSRNFRSMTYGSLKNYTSMFNRDDNSYYKNDYDYSPRDYDRRAQPTSRDGSPFDKYRNKYQSPRQNTPVKRKILPDNEKLKKRKNEKPRISKDPSVSPKVTKRSRKGNDYLPDKKKSQKDSSPSRSSNYSERDLHDENFDSDDQSSKLKKHKTIYSERDLRDENFDSDDQSSKLKKHKTIYSERDSRDANIDADDQSSNLKKHKTIYSERDSRDANIDPDDQSSKLKKRKTIYSERDSRDANIDSDDQSSKLKKRKNEKPRISKDPSVSPKVTKRSRKGNDYLPDKKKSQKDSSHSRSSNYSERDLRDANIESDDQSSSYENADRKKLDRQESRLSQKYNQLEIHAGSDDEFQDEWYNDYDTPAGPVSMVSRVSPKCHTNTVEDSNDDDNAIAEPVRQKKHKKDSKKKKKHKKHKKHKSSKVSNSVD